MKKKSALFLLSVIIFLFAFGIFTRNHATLSSMRDTSSGPSAFSPSRSSITQQSESDTPPGGISYPVSVNLQDIAPNQYDPNNQYDRWQRGETQLDRGEHIVDPLRIAEMRLNALRLPTGKVDIASSAGPGQFAPALVSGFDSIDQPECCGGGSNVPPDPEIAVGQNHVIAVVNVAFEIYDKNGTSVVGPTTFASLFNSVSMYEPLRSKCSIRRSSQSLYSRHRCGRYRLLYRGQPDIRPDWVMVDILLRHRNRQ